MVVINQLLFAVVTCSALGKIEKCSKYGPLVCASVPCGSSFEFRNECVARKHGATVVHTGPCRPGESEESEECFYTSNERSANNCACPLQSKPVCGNDKNNYNNPCLAACAGTSVQSLGYCKRFSLTGHTRSSKKSCYCPKTRRYTLGCDGKLYSNSCEARCRSGGVHKDGNCFRGK